MTPAERERRFYVIRLIGCLACRRRGWYCAPDVHHLNLGAHAGGERLGDAYTIGLDPWHHRGVAPDGMSAHEARRVMGPSLAKEPNAFRETFGSDEELLHEENRLIRIHQQRVIGRRVA